MMKNPKTKGHKFEHDQMDTVLDGLIDLSVPSQFEAVHARIDAIAAQGSATAQSGAAELLLLGEEALETWILARHATPTQETCDGFRLLALLRQSVGGASSLPGCGETCREMVYFHNLIVTQSPDAARKSLRQMALATKRLVQVISAQT